MASPTTELTSSSASNTLYQAECTAYEQQRRAARNPNAYHSPIFPPGTEYAVCQAEAQLMSAVVGLMNENIMEAMKSFYKLRKAYVALEGIMEHERKYLEKKGVSSVGSRSSTRPGSVRSKTGSSILGRSGQPNSVGASAAASTASLRLNPGAETPVLTRKGTGHSKQTTIGGDQGDFVDADEKLQGEGLNAATDDLEKLTLQVMDAEGADLSAVSDHPVDAFILAGSNFCFGMMQLLLSFIPPSFASLLKVIGFKGDRERGMRMLWQATKFNDIHGAMSGICLMGYLNGFTSLCDMIPASGEGSYPKERCKVLLGTMRQRYPRSHLWLLEESRMLAADGELETAVEFLDAAGASTLKQLEALGWFERSLNNMYMHDYKATASAFEKCITLNNWSHGLYWYICGASYVEMYRKSKTTDPEAAKQYGVQAEEYFNKVIPNTGKKKFMGRQLPFDVFCARKIQKWETRAKEWNCDFIDAIGVSPIEEMIFFWNGSKRMRSNHLEDSLENLAWSESPANPHWDKEGLDEKSILHLLRASTLRHLNRTTEAKAILEKDIISVDRTLFKGPLKDSWTAPCARYEMAANLWREANADFTPEEHKETLNKCKERLAEVTSWDGFDLDARSVHIQPFHTDASGVQAFHHLLTIYPRIGMKITTAKDTLKKYGIQV
jgi:tetratricopeptide (TPR) repeat protein